MVKMDTDAVRSLASSIQNIADDFDTRYSGIVSTVTSVNWQSRARDEFVDNLNMVTRAGTSSASALRLMAKAASRKADQWEAVGSVFNGVFYFLEGIWDNARNAIGNSWNNILGTIGSIRWPSAMAIGGIGTGIGLGIAGWFDGIKLPWNFEKPDWWPFPSNKNISANGINTGPIISNSGEIGTTIPPVEPTKIMSPVEPIGLDQDDPRWGNQIMGMPSHTIDNKGCLITSVAMIARFKGVDATPMEVNTYLKENRGYVEGTSNMKFDVAENFLELSTGKNVTYKQVQNSTLSSMLDSKNPVIIHVKGNSSDGHWVVATGLDSNGKYVVYESSTGKQSTYTQNQLLPPHWAFEFEE